MLLPTRMIPPSEAVITRVVGVSFYMEWRVGGDTRSRSDGLFLGLNFLAPISVFSKLEIHIHAKTNCDQKRLDV
jgi:hypothetical protein